MLGAYRSTGADPPFGDPVRPHGVAMEGWFWRFTQPATGEVVVVLAGVNRAADGRPWGTVGMAGHPGGFSTAAAVPGASAAGDGSLRIGAALRAGGGTLALDLGPDARLEASVEPLRPWPRWKAFGGIGPAHALPGLSQYWHPWLLAGRARGQAVVGGRSVDLDGALVYGEKNWSNRGFPERWWWGQSHAFTADPEACVAFAGGTAGVGPLRMEATALVVSAAGLLVRLVRAGPVGSTLEVSVGDGGWRLAGRTRDGVAVVVEGEANGTRPHLLPIPVPAEGRHEPDAAAQHLAGELRLSLRRGRRLLYSDSSPLAGLEQGAAPDPDRLSRFQRGGRPWPAPRRRSAALTG